MHQQLVVVTGGSSGIGACIAKLYAAKGAHVLLLARNEELLARIAADIQADGGAAAIFPVDLADPIAVEAVAQRILQEAGPPDVLINNAGAGRWLPLLQTTPADVQAMIAVPYLASVYLTHALLPAMVAKGSGTIACISSPASYFAWPNAVGYIAARRAVRGFAEGLRAEVRPYGLKVTLAILGTVESPYWEHNPGSRQNLPAANPILLPVLSVEQAAVAVVRGIERGERLVVKPGFLRALFLLNALFPNLVASQIRKAANRARQG